MLPVSILQQLGLKSFGILGWKRSNLLASYANFLAAWGDLVAGSC